VPNTRFQEVSDRWADGLGNVRDAVRQEVVRRQLSEMASARPLRVIDLGCGQGTQLLHLARAGHQVTGLDISADLLARCEADLSLEPDAVRERVRLIRGPLEDALALVGSGFDLVLCHGVLMYFDEIGPVLSVLDRLAGPRARLALLVRNGLAPAMRDGLRGDGAGALASFDSLEYVNRLGIAARAHTPEELDDELAPLGWRRHRWYGVRVFTDHLGDTPPPTNGFADLLDAEEQAARRDPYRQVAALLHVFYNRVERVE
jgi:S-adenosylmethionine-dependent methyltransferase